MESSWAVWPTNNSLLPLIQDKPSYIAPAEIHCWDATIQRYQNFYISPSFRWGALKGRLLTAQQARCDVLFDCLTAYIFHVTWSLSLWVPGLHQVILMVEAELLKQEPLTGSKVQLSRLSNTVRPLELQLMVN